METKGLCDTCNNDKSCVLRVRLPILQCEEFSNFSHRMTKAGRIKQKISSCFKEVVTEE